VWRRHRSSPLALGLAGAALAYPASLVSRLTQAGGEASSRSSEFLFLGVAFTLAVGIVELWPPAWSSLPLLALRPGALAIIFLGGVIVGNPPWGRLPGPYVVAADARSVEPQGITAAQWARATLGPDNRVLADRINGLLMASYGDQWPVTNSEGVYRAGPFFSLELGPADRAVFQQGRVRYLVIDRRLTTALPLVGTYIEAGEPDSYQHTTPLDPAALAKFDSLANVSRLFDSGDIQIYDVQALAQTP
jgi:hypothetical protein